MNERCEICNRTFYSNEGRFPVGGPTKHHVTPYQYHKRNNYKEEIIVICWSCQKQLHKMFSNNELKSMSKQELMKQQKVIDWIKWITKNYL